MLGIANMEIKKVVPIKLMENFLGAVANLINLNPLHRRFAFNREARSIIAARLI